MSCFYLKNFPLKDFVETCKELLKNPGKATDFERVNLMQCFPCRNLNISKGEIIENPNYLIFQILRKWNISPKVLEERLKVSPQIAEKILKEKFLIAKFPIVDTSTGKGFLNSALIIPLGERKLIFPEEEILPLEIKEGLDRVLKTTLQGFFITFKYIPFKGQSFTLAVYSILKFREIAENLAFTGVLTDTGGFNEVEHLEEKLKTAHSQSFPLVFSQKGVLEKEEQLKEFLTDLKVPISSLLKKEDVKLFESFLSFRESYLKKVFNLKTPLHYCTQDGKFNEKVSEFEKYEKWLSDVIAEVKEKISPKLRNIKIATAHKIISLAFLSGLKFSKARLPTIVYKFKNGSYKPTFNLESDLFDEKVNLTGYFDVFRPNDFDEIVISTKSEIVPNNRTLLLKAKKERLPEESFKGIAQAMASYLRQFKGKHYRLKMEIPVSLALALGFYLEDYLNLSVYHKNLVAFRIGKEGNLYLTNTFSIAMLPVEEVQLNFQPVDLKEVEEILSKENVISYISHLSTSQILTKLFGREIPFNRSKLELKKGDTVIVFQIYKRPKEGQIFSEEELQEILSKRDFKFWKVYILG